MRVTEGKCTLFHKTEYWWWFIEWFEENKLWESFWTIRYIKYPNRFLNTSNYSRFWDFSFLCFSYSKLFSTRDFSWSLLSAFGHNHLNHLSFAHRFQGFDRCYPNFGHLFPDPELGHFHPESWHFRPEWTGWIDPESGHREFGSDLKPESGSGSGSHFRSRSRNKRRRRRRPPPPPPAETRRPSLPPPTRRRRGSGRRRRGCGRRRRRRKMRSVFSPVRPHLIGRLESAPEQLRGWKVDSMCKRKITLWTFFKKCMFEI